MLADGVAHEAIVHAVEAAEKSKPGRASPSSSGRGARLPSDWMPSTDDVTYAGALQLPEALIALETEKFRNYWLAKTGSSATKRDWSATWKNWILTAMERRYDASRSRGRTSAAVAVTGRPATGPDAVLAGMGRLAHRLAEERGAAAPDHSEVAQSHNAPRRDGADDGGA
jgi:hypothetical protein